MSPRARRPVPSTRRVRRTRSLDPTPTPELLPRSPSDAAIRARRPHVNRSAGRPVIGVGAGSRTTHSRLRRAHELESPISNAGGGVARRRRIHDCSAGRRRDRKSTRLNSSHGYISYAVFCLKKKKKKDTINELDSQN